MVEATQARPGGGCSRGEFSTLGRVCSQNQQFAGGGCEQEDGWGESSLTSGIWTELLQGWRCQKVAEIQKMQEEVLEKGLGEVSGMLGAY